MNVFQLEKELGRIIKRTSRLLSQNLQNELNSLDVRITVEQWGLLFVLREEQGLSQTELSERAFKDKPTTTRMMMVLEKQNLLRRERNNADKRAFHIFLTEKGKKVVDEVIPLAQKVLKKAQRGLSEQESAELKRMLEVVNHNLSP